MAGKRSVGVAGREQPVEVLVVRHGVPLPDLAGLLTAGDRARLASASAHDRSRLVAGRTALLGAAARFSGLPPSAITIDASCPDCGRSHGRPQVRGASSPIHVSLTHAGGRAIAVASAVPVGVDAETRATLRAKRAAVRAVTGAARTHGIRHWTQVEAILKADGRGLRVDPGAVTVDGRRGAVADSPSRYRLSAWHRVPGLLVSIAQEIPVPGRAGTAA